MAVKERNIVTDPDPVFGRLNWEVFPYDPIVLTTGAVVGVVGICVVFALFRYRLLGYLWREWITTVDHKKISLMYGIVALIMMIRGFADAVLMRSHQVLASSDTFGSGYLSPEHYDQIFTAHAVIMIFFVAMPLVAAIWNYLTPLQIGARDVAFPFMNNLAFWFFASGAILVNISLFIGEFAATGWLAYPPLSGIEFSPWVGVDYWIWSLQIAGIGTTMTSINFIVTILKMRAPGLKLMMMPVSTWTTLTAATIGAIIFPILTVTIAMLTTDRYFDTHFFTNELGGNQMMWVNLIWVWGHPEVYLLVLPAFGVFSEVVPVFSRKSLFGYKGLVYATAVIGLLSMIVWLHHFFTMGAGASVNAFFGIATMAIAIPTGVKLFNWLFTMYKGRVKLTAEVYWTMAFFVTFTVGGMTGVMLSIPAADFVLHNSLFLVAHFHNVIIGGAVFGYLTAVHFWWPKFTGWQLNPFWGKLAPILWTIGFFVSFMPIYALGFMGATRRLNYYDNPEWAPYFAVAAFGVGILFLGALATVINLVVSFLNRHKNMDVCGDFNDGRTMEWSTSSPPPYYNFAKTPHFHAIDEWHLRKENGMAYQKITNFERIHMPCNTWAGPIMGLTSIPLGFAAVWHIWWVFFISFAIIIGTLILHTLYAKREYYVETEEVEAIETARWEALRQVGKV